ncbi:MAG: hypothetical protein NZ890_07055 [Myxococcota bacterium]|nr:hypothetical protein [Myxococcota bacterium]
MTTRRMRSIALALALAAPSPASAQPALAGAEAAAQTPSADRPGPREADRPPQAPSPPPSAGYTSYGAEGARLHLALGPPPGSFRDDPLVRRGVYDRPYLMRLGSPTTDVALGGYFDLVASYLQQQGVSDGFTAEARRFNLFVTSRIADRVRLSSEIELEHGTRAISIEFAALDVLLHHTLNLRGGIVLVPIGKFNLAHDSPLYDVVDRPLVSTRILPSTYGDVGGGLFGAFYPGGHKLTYEAYIVNGLGEGILAAEGTRIAQGRASSRFERDANGQPAVTARLGYASPPRRWLQLETALSFYAGAYNTPVLEGLQVDPPRWLHLLAWDLEASIGPLTLRGEAAYARIDLPQGLTERHASEQAGLYAEIVGTIFKRPLVLFQRASLAAVGRLDWVDLNLNRRPDGEPVGDETLRLTLGVSFRPAPGTSLRVGYRHDWIRDPLNNPLRGGGFQLGIASYF